MLPPPTDGLLHRLEAIGVEFTVAGLEGGGAGAVHRFGDAVATLNPELPDLDFVNRVGLLTSPDHVAEIVSLYRERGVRPWFELLPGEQLEAVAAALRAHGAGQVGFHSLLYGLPETSPSPVDLAVDVERIDASQADTFADVRVRGLEVTQEHREGARRVSRAWADVDWWRLYLARIDGVPVAMAVLAVCDGLGYLANAATLPEFRGRGAQSALIARRIADAEAEGCELVVSQCVPGGTSHRNLHRAGLRVACTKAVWRVL